MGFAPARQVRNPRHQAPRAGSATHRTLRRLRFGLRSERGTAALELALVMPILAGLVMGIIDFGVTYQNWSALRQGTWAAARAASVANFGAGSSCSLTFTGGSTPSGDIEDLMCLAKVEIGLDQSSTRIDVVISDPTLTQLGYPWGVDGSVTVCAQIPAHSATGFFSGAFDGHYLRAKTTIRIEEPSANAETQGYEADPSGSGWSWCTPTSVEP